MRKSFGFLLGAALSLALPAFAAQVTGPVAAPDVPGSPSRDYIFFASNHDLAAHGYVEEEYFIRGTATTYKTGGAATSDVLATDQPYYTRFVVRRPVDAKRFNGAAIVEWYNVSNFFDAENVWFDDWEDMMRSGYVWVGVSPQVVGVETLKKWNAKRYADFTVGKEAPPTSTSAPRPANAPDIDAMSFDIFTQVGQALKHPSGVDPLGGLKLKVLLATGQSQSAGRLSTYANNIQPIANVYDGFLLVASNTIIRSDLKVPVFKLMAEHDVLTGGAATEQPDTDKYREWEVAGTSHMSQHVRVSREQLELRDNGVSLEAGMAPLCANPQIGTRTPMGQVVAAALASLSKWAAGGKPPAIAPKLNITQVNKAPQQSVAERNSDGLAQGGIQLASQAVPTQINYGVNAPSKAATESGIRGEAIGAGACVRWGPSTDMTLARLKQLYPTHADYVAKVRKVVADNVAKGFLLKVDGDAQILAAQNSGVGDW